MARKPTLQGGRGRRRSFPSFFKVLIRDFSDQLRLPPALKKHFDGVCLEENFVLSRGGRTWPVRVRKVDEDFFFEKGWKSFQQENSLEMQDFLVFHYAAEASTFVIEVYGKNCCLKETRRAIEKKRNSVTVPSRKGKAKEEKATKENQPEAERGKRNVRPTEESPTDQSRQESLEAEGSSDHIKTEHLDGMVPEKPPVHSGSNGWSYEEASKFNSDLPHFGVKLSLENLHKYALFIPAAFSKIYIKRNSKNRGSVKLQSSDQLVTVRLIRFRNGQNIYYKMTAGWVEFVRKNKLKAGDICMFELIDKKHLVLKVSIFSEVCL